MRVLLFSFLVVLYTSASFSQVNKQKQIQREKDKVTIFTPEERSNLQLWFYDQTQLMGLTEETNIEYERIFYTYIYQMSRLNDKDKDYSDEEINDLFEQLVDKMNVEMKQLLTREQYIQHLENFGEIVRRAYRKLNWN
jgi:hypothetical protein